MYILGDSSDASKQINCTLETPREQTSASQEKIANRCGLEIEYGGWSSPFNDLEVNSVEEGAD
jgi:hypothetical protein